MPAKIATTASEFCESCLLCLPKSLPQLVSVEIAVSYTRRNFYHSRRVLGDLLAMPGESAATADEYSGSKYLCMSTPVCNIIQHALLPHMCALQATNNQLPSDKHPRQLVLFQSPFAEASALGSESRTCWEYPRNHVRSRLPADENGQLQQ